MKLAILFVMVALVLCAAGQAQESRWGSPDDPLVKEMVAKEKMWADSNCGPQAGLEAIIAEDFQGTASSDGSRYGKDEAISTDATSLDKDCRFGAMSVRFFGEGVAVAYGDESSLRKGKDGNYVKQCLVWTDTWLKRQGRWQIVAAQDNVIRCK
jgi:hypothetical protein